MTEKFYYKSPIGILEIELKENFVVGLRIVECCEKYSESRGYFKEVKKQLDEYFAGKRIRFDLNVFQVGTDFQKQVWTELQKIPYGETKSYQEIAELIGKPKAQRTVGLACNKNHILLIIPCHRAISKTGNISGFEYGVVVKEALLKLENAI